MAVDPVTQFVCAECGRIFNQELQEEDKDGRAVDVTCFKLAGGKPSLPETRVVNMKQRAFDKAEKELKEAKDAEAKAKSDAEAKAKSEEAVPVQPPVKTVPVPAGTTTPVVHS